MVIMTTKRTNKTISYLLRPRWWLFILISIWLASNPIIAATQVSITASETLTTIGEPIHLDIRVTTTANIQEIKIKSEKNPFEIIDQQPTHKRAEQNYIIFEKTYTIAFFSLGDFNIGPFTLDMLQDGRVLESKETNSIPIKVKTVLSDEDKDIKALKSPIKIDGNAFYFLKYVIAAVILIIIVILLIIWLKRRKKFVPSEPIPSLPPLVEFEMRINELWNKKWLDKGKPKFHFIELTRIMKNFMHRNYGFNAEDLTTYETLAALINEEKQTSLTDNWRFIFNTTDLVKFAQFIPDQPVMNEVYDKLSNCISLYRMRMPKDIPGEESDRTLVQKDKVT